MPFSDIRAIRVSIVARSQKKDPNWNGGQRISIEDHNPTTTQEDKRYRRRLLSSTIRIRNAGLF